MKLNFIDRLVGFFNPEAGALRAQSRMKQDLLLRGYDAAKDFRTSDWTSAGKTSANEEIKAGQKKIRERSRDVARNNPYGVRAINVITSNTVGSGIIPNFTGATPKQTEILRLLWKQWGETTACDATGRSNFYGLQAQVMRTVVESGEGLSIFVGQPPTGPQFKILEADFIVSDENKDDGSVIQGIVLDKQGKRTSYVLYTQHPGDAGASTKSVSVPATEVSHIFRQTRPGQVRGMPWSHAILEALKDFDDYQRATLIGRKIAACFAAFITTNETPGVLSAADLKTKRENEMNISPAEVRYLGPGESMQLASPPAVAGYAEFSRESLRAIAAGYGISFEAFTGDYSQSNYSSSRLGHLEFRRNIEDWRWNMLIPQFCEPAIERFKIWASINGAGAPETIMVDWTPPAYEMIDPTKDISAIQKAIRSGLLTLPQAIRAQGYDPKTQLEEIADSNKQLDALGIALDTDPRKLSNMGMSQSTDPLNVTVTDSERNLDTQETNSEADGRIFNPEQKKR